MMSEDEGRGRRRTIVLLSILMGLVFLAGVIISSVGALSGGGAHVMPDGSTMNDRNMPTRTMPDGEPRPDSLSD